MANNQSYDQIAKEFVTFYYQTFDGDRRNLASLYRDQSMLTFETALIGGANAIVEKLVSLHFKKVKHEVTTVDAQPSHIDGGIVILVTGRLLVDEEQRPMNYAQTFQLLRDPNGQFFVLNDFFKLIYG